MSAIGKTSEQIYMTKPEEDVWLVLELYGVSIQIESVWDRQDDKNREIDVPDAKPYWYVSDCNASEEGKTQPKTRPMSPSMNHNLESYVQYNPMPVSPVSESSQPEQYTRDGNLASARNIAQSSDKMLNLAEGIQNNFTQILKSFTPKGHFADLLFEKRYITGEQLQEIQNSTSDQTRTVLLIMMKRPIHRRLLEKALDETGQNFLLPKFLNEEEKE